MLSRLDNDKLDLRPRRFQVADMVRHVYEAMKIDAQSRGHTLRLELHEPGSGSTGDVERLEQVLVNVVGDSVKYTPDGGEILIEAHREGDKVVMRVQDETASAFRMRIWAVFLTGFTVWTRPARAKWAAPALGLAIAKEDYAGSRGRNHAVKHFGQGHDRHADAAGRRACARGIRGQPPLQAAARAAAGVTHGAAAPWEKWKTGV